MRSARFNRNLFDKFNKKKCAFCECNVDESIQGAHIWEVAKIRKDPKSSIDQKIAWATDGENGLWLCGNHHKWFDSDIIRISFDGDILIDEKLATNKLSYIEEQTTVRKLSEEICTPEFVEYIKKRYKV